MSLLLGLNKMGNKKMDRERFLIIFFQGVVNLFLFPIFIMGLVHKECPTCQRNIFLCDVVCKYCKNIVGVKTLR